MLALFKVWTLQSGCILTWRGGQPWSKRRFLQGEALPLHFGWVDPCDYPKCGNGCVLQLSKRPSQSACVTHFERCLSKQFHRFSIQCHLAVWAFLKIKCHLKNKENLNARIGIKYWRQLYKQTEPQLDDIGMALCQYSWQDDHKYEWGSGPIQMAMVVAGGEYAARQFALWANWRLLFGSDQLWPSGLDCFCEAHIPKLYTLSTLLFYLIHFYKRQCLNLKHVWYIWFYSTVQICGRMKTIKKGYGLCVSETFRD